MPSLKKGAALLGSQPFHRDLGLWYVLAGMEDCPPAVCDLCTTCSVIFDSIALYFKTSQMFYGKLCSAGCPAALVKSLFKICTPWLSRAAPHHATSSLFACWPRWTPSLPAAVHWTWQRTCAHLWGDLPGEHKTRRPILRRLMGGRQRRRLRRSCWPHPVGIARSGRLQWHSLLRYTLESPKVDITRKPRAPSDCSEIMLKAAI